jgi:ribosomal protein S18 acetylase RimI-like enzyme
MPDLILRRATEGDSDSMAALVSERCALPGFRCLHTWQGEEQSELVEAFRSHADSEEHAHVVLLDGDTMIGVAGAEFDRDLGCAWLHGPVVAAEAMEGAPALLAFLLSVLPPGIHRWQVFLEAANGFTRELYAERGFEERDRRYLGYMLDGYIASEESPFSEEVLQGADHDAFFDLLLALFPKPYWTRERMLAMQGDAMELVVRHDGGELTGFAVVYMEPGTAVGEVQYLGVRETHRGKGLGRSLLADGVAWLRERGATRVRLNAAAGADAALHLYEIPGGTIARELHVVLGRAAALDDLGALEATAGHGLPGGIKHGTRALLFRDLLLSLADDTLLVDEQLVVAVILPEFHLPDPAACLELALRAGDGRLGHLLACSRHDVVGECADGDVSFHLADLPVAINFQFDGPGGIGHVIESRQSRGHLADGSTACCEGAGQYQGQHHAHLHGDLLSILDLR